MSSQTLTLQHRRLQLATHWHSIACRQQAMFEQLVAPCEISDSSHTAMVSMQPLRSQTGCTAMRNQHFIRYCAIPQWVYDVCQ